MTDYILKKCQHGIGWIVFLGALYVAWNIVPAAQQAIKFIWEIKL